MNIVVPIVSSFHYRDMSEWNVKDTIPIRIIKSKTHWFVPTMNVSTDTPITEIPTVKLSLQVKPTKDVLSRLHKVTEQPVVPKKPIFKENMNQTIGILYICDS